MYRTPICSHCLIIVCCVIFLESCARLNLNGPDRRIDQSATLFNQKSFEDKQAITNGMILPGMTRDAVYLAWGNPKSRLVGVENGRPFEEWSYEKVAPKVDFRIGVGKTPAVGVEKKYTKSVRFVDGRVNSYQQKM